MLTEGVGMVAEGAGMVAEGAEWVVEGVTRCWKGGWDGGGRGDMVPEGMRWWRIGRDSGGRGGMVQKHEGEDITVRVQVRGQGW